MGYAKGPKGSGTIVERWLSPEAFLRWTEKNKKISKEWKKKNPKRNAELNRLSRKRNPHKRSEVCARRRAEALYGNQEISEEDKKLISCFYKCSKRVSDCLGIKHHVDHIVPLARGGLHIPSNLQVLPAIVNLRKGSK